jgi:hypothetical protein
VRCNVFRISVALGVMVRNWKPSIVPSGFDQTVYLVLDDLGPLGRAYCETDPERADLETTATDLMSGQYGDPFASLPSRALGRTQRMLRGRFYAALILPVTSSRCRLRDLWSGTLARNGTHAAASLARLTSDAPPER